MEAGIAAVLADIASAPLASSDDAEAFRVRFLGRKSGVVTALFGRLGEAPPDERRAIGQRLNALKAAAEARLAAVATTDGPARGATALDLTLVAGERRATYVLQAGSALNPFTRNPLRGFRCPTIR